MPRLIDISPRIGPGVPVWPGDTPPAWEWTAALERGDPMNLGKLTLSPHTGTHVDAPLHLVAGGEDVASLPVEIFWGRARVVSWIGRSALDRGSLEGLDWQGVERVLFRTRRAEEPLRYRPGYVVLQPAAARFLCEQGVTLVGVDTPSVDPFDSTDLPAHRVLARARVAILECLELGEVAAGDYELAALPLKLAGADASPVRAVLRARF